MDSYIDILQCTEQAERIRRTLETLERARQSVRSALRQVEDQTCPNAIDELRCLEKSLAAAQEDTTRLYRALFAVIACYEDTEAAVKAAVLALPTGRITQHTANSSDTVQREAALQRQQARMSKPSAADWVRVSPRAALFQLPDNEQAEDWLVEQMLQVFAGTDNTKTDRGQK